MNNGVSHVDIANSFDKIGTHGRIEQKHYKSLCAQFEASSHPTFKEISKLSADIESCDVNCDYVEFTASLLPTMSNDQLESCVLYHEKCMLMIRRQLLVNNVEYNADRLLLSYLHAKACGIHEGVISATRQTSAERFGPPPKRRPSDESMDVERAVYTEPVITPPAVVTSAAVVVTSPAAVVTAAPAVAPTFYEALFGTKK